MENLFFTCRVVVGFWRHSNQPKPHVSVTTSSFPAKKFKQKIPRSKKDKAQFVFILEFFWVEVAFLESQDHYLQNLEKRSVVVQVAL